MFRKGDRVRCIKDVRELKLNQYYIIKYIDDTHLWLDDIIGDTKSHPLFLLINEKICLEKVIE